MMRTHPARFAFRSPWSPIMVALSWFLVISPPPLAATPDDPSASDPSAGDRAAEANRTDGQTPSDTIDFTRDIRPILSNHCFKCHGPDEATREAGLRLDTAEGATEDFGGYQPIVPHDAELSEVVARLTSDDEFLRMPPAGSGLELSDAQIRLLTQWIDAGAQYDLHWSFNPIVPSGPRSIDARIDRKLRSLGLQRSPRAERTTQIRRLYLDLLGVAPTPESVTRFVTDQSPDAYRRLVDRLLADPRFGEKWGRHWLDQARYADTHGYTIDSPRTMWPYRDWVIDAVNEDKPFDRFTIEQLAGDLLPEPTLAQQVATGFHRNTLINQEGGTDKEQFRNEVAVDRVNTTGAVWMGMTVGCAQCHTHKFDPLTHREYFQLFAFFNQAVDANGVAPTVPVPTPDQQRQLEQSKQRLDEAKAALRRYERSRSESAAAGEQGSEASESPTKEPWTDAVRWVFPDELAVESDAGASFERLDDGSWLAQGENGKRDAYRVSFRLPVDRVTGLRLETLTHPSLPRDGPGRASNGNFVLNEIELTVDGKPVKWVHATADHSQPNYDVTAAIDGDGSTGWAINGGSKLNTDRVALFVNEPIERNADDDRAATVTMTFGNQPARYNIGRFRLAVTDVPPSRLGVPDPKRLALEATRDRAQKAWDRVRKSIPNTMVMRDVDTPRESFVHIRGDFLRHGKSVSPGTPAVLPPLHRRRTSGDDQQDVDGTQPPTRLDLARWLVDPDHPLTARVTVNRIWMRLFGRGLVETENDFGLQGTTPTHPGLLDRLAGDWIEGGWSRKRLIRQIVLSETYRQSSRSNPESEAVDPLNQYLSRQSRIRVDAEIVRDVALSTSGLIDRTIGGPSVYPPQPDGVYAFTQRGASWPESDGGNRYRRGMYTFFMRSAPHPMLTTFDSPSFNTTCTRRVRSNTPLQSLTMANDLAMVEAAQAMASRLFRESGPNADDRDLVTRAFRIAFSRHPDKQELEELTGFLERQRRAFADAPDQAARFAGVATDDPDVEHDNREDHANTAGDASGEGHETNARVSLENWGSVTNRAAVTMLARVLMNVDEFITRE